MSRTSVTKYDFSPGRGGQGFLLILMCGLGIVIGIFSAGRVQTGQTPAVNSDKMQLANEKIDPNTASRASLRRLPGIDSAADVIIEYRRKFAAAAPAGKPAFQRLEDLCNVPRIGLITALRLQPYLEFPAATGTQPKPDTCNKS